jgi:transcriptional regulator with XRE-family HTH domain
MKKNLNHHFAKTRATCAEDLLRLTLSDRCAKNPQYSIRAFAKSSGISHTVLSLVLSGKRTLSKAATQKLVDYLELSPKERESLIKTNKKSNVDTDFQDLSLETFEVISDWYHYAILSLLELPEAKFEAKWIAGQLGIKILSAKLAIERLKKIGLVEEISAGVWRQSGKPIKIDNKISTAATKKFHKQLLERASVSIDRDPISVRDFSAITFTLDPSQIDYAKNRMREFRRQLMNELEAMGQPSAVYNMTIQFYPVTPITESNS